LHLACGRHILDGWVNCDVAHHPGAARQPDLVCDVASLPLDAGVASEILAVHILEHFYEWEVAGVLAEWHRLLKPGGLLVIEMPDIIKAAKNLIAGANDQMAMWPMYGDNTLKQPLMCHKWGWTYKTLRPALERAGFELVIEMPTEWHGRKQNRDFRVEARKC
jgi:predicted SAM-dependent methyltransferase